MIPCRTAKAKMRANAQIDVEHGDGNHVQACINGLLSDPRSQYA